MTKRALSCEPNFILPEDVSIARLKQETKAVAESYKVQEKFEEVNASKEELQETFSLNRNDYFRCKWNRFLENVPKQVLVIKPYLEYKKEKIPVRRMILNGSYYLDNGKLIPVPYVRRERK